jgi:hypothetical protein
MKIPIPTTYVNCSKPRTTSISQRCVLRIAAQLGRLGWARRRLHPRPHLRPGVEGDGDELRPACGDVVADRANPYRMAAIQGQV